MLTLFGPIMKGDSSLALKDFTSKSWFIHLVRLCGKYDLPLPHLLVDGSITPQSWNFLVKRTVFSFWFRTMSQDAITKSTLRFISIDLLLPGNRVRPIQYGRMSTVTPERQRHSGVILCNQTMQNSITLWTPHVCSVDPKTKTLCIS